MYSTFLICLVVFAQLCAAELQGFRYVEVLKDQLNELPVHRQISSEGRSLRDRIEYLSKYRAEVRDGASDYDRIYALLFSNVSPVSNPTALFVGGGTASGKSSVIRVNQQSDNVIMLDSDAIMMELSAWNTSDFLCRAEILHPNASIISAQILTDAIQGKYNVLVDGTMSNFNKTATTVISAVNAGYTIRMIGVTADVTTAAIRAAGRAQATGRWVPLSVIVGTQAKYSANFEQYTALFSSYSLYDTNAVPILLVNDSVIYNKTAYAEFLSKAYLTEEQVINALPSSVVSLYQNFSQDCVCVAGNVNSNDAFCAAPAALVAGGSPNQDFWTPDHTIIVAVVCGVVALVIVVTLIGIAVRRAMSPKHVEGRQ